MFDGFFFSTLTTASCVRHFVRARDTCDQDAVDYLVGCTFRFRHKTFSESTASAKREQGGHTNIPTSTYTPYGAHMHAHVFSILPLQTYDKSLHCDHGIDSDDEK